MAGVTTALATPSSLPDPSDASDPPTAKVGLPDLVPASMLGAYAYCPRLFFLEWVDALWATNADVAEGRRLHARVDAGGGAVPPPGEGEVRAARSVALASETLGITGVLDLVEADPDTATDPTDPDPTGPDRDPADTGGQAGATAVVPVETKKGRPTGDGTAWDADAIQVCAQILLLREHGHRCDRGEIFYAGTRQRIAVDATDDLVERTTAALAAARECAARLRPPPPLEASARPRYACWT